MSAGYCLAWTLADGTRHANPIPRDKSLVEALAGVMGHERQGTVYVALPAEELDKWKAQAMDTNVAIAPAEEMMINADGDPVPARLVQERLRLEDQTVNTLLAKAAAMQARMRDFKLEAVEDVDTFLDLLAANYRSDRKGKRGGVTLTSYDGLRQVTITAADTMTFGPELGIAKDLIDACIRDWAKGTDPALQTLVNDAFRIGATGKIQKDRVLGLRRLDIRDERWVQAMNAISDALRIERSRSYIRFYSRPRQDAKFEQVVLDMSSL